MKRGSKTSKKELFERDLEKDKPILIRQFLEE
jgi:hypothetical protein